VDPPLIAVEDPPVCDAPHGDAPAGHYLATTCSKNGGVNIAMKDRRTLVRWVIRGLEDSQFLAFHQFIFCMKCESK
jgi:hypothetical protein